MVDARRQDETVETTQEFVILRMSPTEAGQLQAYLSHIEFEQQREYLTDEIVNLLEDMFNALKDNVPSAPVTVTRPQEAEVTPSTIPERDKSVPSRDKPTTREPSILD